MRIVIFGLLIALPLAACAPSLADQNMAIMESNTAIIACSGQKLPNYTAIAQCDADGITAAFKNRRSPYMDLVQSSTHQLIVIAQQVDSGTMTVDDGKKKTDFALQGMVNLMSQMNEEDSQRRALFAGALLNASQAYQQSLAQQNAAIAAQQQKQLNCTTTYSGNTAQTQCH